MKKSFLFIKTFLSSLVLFNTCYVLGQNQWDGIYRSNFPFQMSKQSVCSKTLPIKIEIQIENRNLIGSISNSGGENRDRYCKKYHNGSISGFIDDDGNFLDVKIKQSDSHSRQYSSFKIEGNINDTLFLISKSKKYHPVKEFKIEEFSALNKPVKVKEEKIEKPVKVMEEKIEKPVKVNNEKIKKETNLLFN